MSDLTDARPECQECSTPTDCDCDSCGRPHCEECVEYCDLCDMSLCWRCEEESPCVWRD